MRSSSGFRFRVGAAGLFILLAFSWVGPGAFAQDPNVCDQPSKFPDVIVGDIDDVRLWGSVGDISAYSIATWSCNIGTCQLDWFSNTSQHPVIAQNMFRLKDGRFEQIGQSWLKHGFFALSLELCETGCVATDGTHLGVNCADPYTSNLNGNQPGLGPKYEVNPSTGQFPYPFTNPAGETGDLTFKRLQVANSDLAPAFNTGALYFVEGQYITHDDAAAGEDDNNASYRRVSVAESGADLFVNLEDETVREQPAIKAWKAHDPSVILTSVDVGDGRIHLGSRATDLGNGVWQYEYAVQNLNSHRGIKAFRVPITAGSTITGIGFHDVDYHSGEPFDGMDWVATVHDDGQSDPHITWRTEDFEANENANALRWGTLYNFRFASDSPPSTALRSARLELFRPGAGTAVSAFLRAPSACDGDGVCDGGETCVSCPADCLGPGETCCGDAVCEGDEDGCNCGEDCGACAVPCDVVEDCDNGFFCDGAEQCVDGFCEDAAESPCTGQVCSELQETCVECLVAATCDDGDFCNGAERCIASACEPGIDPCPGQLCDPQGVGCVECLSDGDCGDGIACNGVETCNDGLCSGATETCLDPQPRMGEPFPGLSAEQLQRFEAGRAAFARVHTEADGLGPLYNGDRCTGCHTNPLDGSGTATVTRFGYADTEGFDPLAELGGPLLHEQSLGAGCDEAMPPIANVMAPQLVRSTLGVGLIEAIPDSVLQSIADNPPAGVSGRVHEVAPLEGPAALRAGRFGWKAQAATLLSVCAAEARDHIGLTNRLLGEDSAPGGDAGLLAQCDTQPDPEDAADAQGVEFIDRVADYLRYLAPPPQTPRSGLSGELHFFSIGCASCHRSNMMTGASGGLDAVVRNKPLKPYSDFLLHDMGTNGDPTGAGDARPGEVRTTPLWGIRDRDPLWHDGRISGGTFRDRMLQAIQLHDAVGGEAAGAAQEFSARPAVIQDQVIALLSSLGRAEFDHDGDHDVDGADYLEFVDCFTGPDGNYNLDHPCRISDFDQDGDVDLEDYDAFAIAFDGRFGGSVPDGASVSGMPMTMDLTAGGSELVLSWDASCAGDDTDYAVYRGLFGAFSSHTRLECTTGGATTTTLSPPSFDAYYLIVATNGTIEGGLGTDSDGNPRPAAPPSEACFPQRPAACD